MPDYHNIDDLVENAFGLYITSRGGTALKALTVIKGSESTEATAPHLAIVAGPCRPFMDQDPTSGDWDADVRLEVVTNLRETSRATHTALVANLRDILVVNDLHTHMNTLAATPLYSILWTISELTKDVAGDCRRQGIRGVLTCNATKS